MFSDLQLYQKHLVVFCLNLLFVYNLMKVKRKKNKTQHINVSMFFCFFVAQKQLDLTKNDCDPLQGH